MTCLPKVAQLEAVVDASYVVKTGSRIVRALDEALRVSTQRAKDTMAHLDPLYGCNGDLWTKFAELHVERQGSMSFTWIKSHQTARMVLSGRSTTRNLHGNILADAFAENAAKRAQLEESVTDEYFSTKATAYHVRRRLIAVHRCIYKHEEEHGKADFIRDYKEKKQAKPKLT